MQQVEDWYNWVEEISASVDSCDLKRFTYEFSIPPNADKFVTHIPAAGEAAHDLFLQLPEDLRTALEAGTPEKVEDALDDMGREERAQALRNCAIGGFFFFKFDFRLAPFDVERFFANSFF